MNGRPRAFGKSSPDEAALDRAITNAEAGFGTPELTKAKELAQFMVSRKIDPSNQNLLRNAYAIAKLARAGTNSRGLEFSESTVQAIDELTSLYALKALDEGTRATLADLASREAQGVDFLVYYLADLRRREAAKAAAAGEVARLNGWKGHIPAESRDGVRLVVAHDTESRRLQSLGYTRLGDYRGSGAENGRRGYYFSTVAGNNTYHQGVMQTVQTSAFGVDPRTGRTLAGFTAGRVPDEMVRVIQNWLPTRKAGEARSIAALTRTALPIDVEAAQPSARLSNSQTAHRG